MLTQLWLLQQSFAGLSAYMRLADLSATGSLVANLADVLGSPSCAESTEVRPRLEIRDDRFNLDLFDEGVTFASRRLLDAMSLIPDAVEVGEVDDRECSVAVKRMGFRTLKLLARGDALDPVESDGEIIDWIDADGSPRRQWMLRVPEPNRPAPRVRWRADFEPPAELFLVNGTPWRAATDALAARVMAAGVVGIDFIDPVASAATGDLVTLRS